MRDTSGQPVIGIDVGATFVRACIFMRGRMRALNDAVQLPNIGRPTTLNFGPLRAAAYKTKTPSASRSRRHEPNIVQETGLDLVRLLASLIRSLSEQIPVYPPPIVAVAIAGTVSQSKKLVSSAPNIWGPGAYDLSSALMGELQQSPYSVSQLVIMSDDYAAGYRYLNSRFLTGARKAYYLTVSSGLGCVRIEPETPLLVPLEPGHEVVIENKEDPLCLRCGCGGLGHLEPLVAGTGVGQLAMALATSRTNQILYEQSTLFGKGDGITAEDVCAAGCARDAFATSIIDYSVDALARHLVVPLLSRTGDTRVIVNGGYARGLSGCAYLGRLRRAVAAVASGMRALSDSVEQLVCMGHDDDFDPLLGTVMVASALQAGELPLSLRDSLVLERTMRNA